MLGQTNAQRIAQQVFKHCAGVSAELLIMVDDSALTRFANNAIHQNVAERNVNLVLRVLLGKRIGTATTNRLDAAAIQEMTARARQNAQAVPEDPLNPGLALPGAYVSVDSYDPQTAEFSAGERARQVGVVCRLASEQGLTAFGAYATGSSELAVANTQGLFAYHPSTKTDFQTVVMSPDSSGFSQASAWRTADFSVEALGLEAIQKAAGGRNPRPIEPGNFTVVVDPYVTDDLVTMLNQQGMGAQAYLEGRSWMNDRLGQKVMDPRVNIWDDGFDPRGHPVPFDYEGVPKQRVDIVRAGVPLTPVYDRYTAHKAGVSSTGHFIQPAFRNLGPLAKNIFMAAGDATLEKMIQSTSRGLYITRFWYTRPVHPRDCLVTGMTRDGVFWIEDGELAYPVKNMRFTQSYLQALNNLVEIGQETRLLFNDYGEISMRVPALKIGSFSFTGATV